MTNIACERDGRFSRCTDLGSYPVCHICYDGGIICADCANAHGHVDKPNDEWRIIASDVNWENTELYCDHCGEHLEPAYGED